MPDFVDPTREAFKALATAPVEGPLHMLDLIRFEPVASYDAGPARTGRQAYAEYGRCSAPVFERVGGRIVVSGRPVAGLVGPLDEIWDTGFLAAYPSRDAFVAMVKDPAYQAIVHHRTAAVADSRLYAFSPRDAGASFG